MSWVILLLKPAVKDVVSKQVVEILRLRKEIKEKEIFCPIAKWDKELEDEIGVFDYAFVKVKDQKEFDEVGGIEEDDYLKGALILGGEVMVLKDAELKEFKERLERGPRDYCVGEKVYVKIGPYKGLIGLVIEVSRDNKQIQIHIKTCSLETVVCLDYREVELLKNEKRKVRKPRRA